MLNTSATLAARHLSKRFSLTTNLFSGYELEYGKGSKAKAAKWTHDCLGIATSRDSVENCVLRQLQALTALCDVPMTADSKEIAEKHLGHLLRSPEIPELAMKLQKMSGASIFLVRKEPDGDPGDMDASPAIQASMLMAAVRCGQALGQKQHLDDAESWFLGLSTIYPEDMWKKSFTSFHRSAMTWEALAVTALHIGKDSSFHQDLEEYLQRFEIFLRDTWEENKEHWSFASARALAVRWFSTKKKKERVKLKQWAVEHVDRFLGRSHVHLTDGPNDRISKGILARIGGSRYTCGPLQGLASLAAILKDAEVIQVVLQLMEKDITRYQIQPSNPGPIRGPIRKPADLLGLLGGFYRDDDQLQLEHRKTLRVDDTAMCLIAITHMLETLASIKSVVVDGAREDL